MPAMKSINQSILIFILTLFSFSALAQIEKGSWQIGINGAPLVDTYVSKVSGGLFSVNVDYFLSNRMSVGIAPYYGFTRDVGHYGYDLITMQPVGYKKKSYDSFGFNIDMKFFLLKSNIVKPYVTLLGGVGKTFYTFYSETEGKTRMYERKTNYNSYNLGLGLGAQFKIANNMYIDAKVMYSCIASFEDPAPVKFVYPSIGLIKSF